MIGRLTQFGAASAKVKAMYAKRLRPEDFARISAMRNVPEVVSFLREHPGWRGAFDGSFDETRRGPLEAGLRRYLLSEYTRVLLFVQREDRFILYDRVLRAEMEQIMRFLRHAGAGRTSDYEADLSALFRIQSRINFDRLSKADTYADMLEAVKNTRFHGALSRLPVGEDGFPEYPSVETVMRHHYYKTLMDMVDKRYRGATRELLRRAVGSQVDMINITNIMRMRKYFPERMDTVIPMLLPVRYKLSPAFIRQLYSAKDDEAAQALLRGSPYGKVFSEHQFTHIEEYYYQYIYDFNRKILTGGIPSVYTPAAYLSLRDVELKNLTAAIERVRYA